MLGEDNCVSKKCLRRGPQIKRYNKSKICWGKTIVSQRNAYEGVHRSRGTTKVKITPGMLKMLGTSQDRNLSERRNNRVKVEERKVSIDMKNVVVRKNLVRLSI